MLGLGALNSGPMNSPSQNLGRVVSVPDSQRWRLRVMIGGADLSERLTGIATVEAEENAARLCTLRLLPLPGLLEADQWTGQPVQLYRQRLEGQSVAHERLWFSGWAQQPRWDLNSRVIALTASCERQRRLASLSLEQVRNLIPGDYAVGLFGAPTDSARYAADLLSTRPRALDSGPDGQFRLTDWAASPQAHFRLSADEIVDGSLELELATADQLVNHVELSVEYRYPRLRFREYVFNWAHPAGNFCTWLADDTELPTLSMLESALDQANWSRLSLHYQALPPSMANPCGGTGAWINRYTADPHLLSFSARVGTRTSQTLTETYRLTLTASGSVAAFGMRKREERQADAVEFDSRDWESQDGGRPAEAVADGKGYWVIDRDASQRRAELLRTALAVEHTRILAQHRLSRVRLQTPIADDLIDLLHTVQVEALGLRAQGKVARVVARWDHDTGAAVSNLELAISRGGAQVAATPQTLPPPPAFDFGAAAPSSPELVTQLGGRPGSPPYNEALDGFSGNYGWLHPAGETHPRRLQITTPEIPARHRDPLTAERTASYVVNVPSDLLLMEAV